MDCFGRAFTGKVSDYARQGLEVGDDGLVDAAVVVRILSAQAFKHHQKNSSLGRTGLSISRLQHQDMWEVQAPGHDRVGWIKPAVGSDQPLARPPYILGAWKAIRDADEEQVWVVSARAAQVLLVQAKRPDLLLPSWADQVRALTPEQAWECQLIAEAKASGGEVEASSLTQWECEEVEPVRFAPGHLFSALIQTRSEPEALSLAMQQTGQVPTPEAVLVRTRHKPDKTAAQWSTRAVAEHLGVTPSTVRSWVARGQMPGPDGASSGVAKWWYPQTILDWEATRPGKGWRGA